ncbi:MAG: hypothetical protein J6X80_06245 [Lachnospiraceae bacterium]|nr:hypothetical protein [Lachnospiraceae bacterium]
MKKITEFLKKNNRYVTVLKTLAALLFPFLMCLVYCAVKGHFITDVFLPSGEWNDELFYFKQVEGTVGYLYPRGYFGFNESHADLLSFAAWSPVLVFPWILWGLVFGWNLLSPVICNIVLLSVTCAVFVNLVKIKVRDEIALGVMMIAFTPFIRYMLSGMPEIICFCACILFAGLTVNYLAKENIVKLILLFVLSAVMTLMRPYLFLFFVMPVFLSIKKYRVKGIIVSAVSGVLTIGIYVFIKVKLSAEYFTPLYNTNWVTDFFDKGFAAGIHNFFYRIYAMCLNIADYVKSGIYTGLCAGAIFASFFVLFLVMTVRLILDIIKFKKEKNEENKNRLFVEGHFIFVLFGMFSALVLMYKLTEGSKHFLTFLALGVFLLALYHGKYYIENIIIVLAFVFFFMIKANSPYDYEVPFKNRAIEAKTSEWQQAFDDNIKIDEDNLSFDNVVIWNFVDVKDGVSRPIKWQYLYMLPKGAGISCCEPQYVKDNFENLKSKYIVTLTGSETDILCGEKGKKLLYADDELSFYALR